MLMKVPPTFDMFFPFSTNYFPTFPLINFRYSYIPPAEKKECGKPAKLGGQGYGVAHSKLYARYLQVNKSDRETTETVFRVF